MGKYGAEEIKNQNWDMIEFCIDSQLLIGRTFFPQKQIHKITFVAEEGNVKSTIDYFTFLNNKR